MALVDAAAVLRDAGRDVVMCLYGEGPELEPCRARAVAKGVAERIEFPGFAQDWARRGADLFVLSSRHEGLCLVVLEAMQAGIAVAAPMIGGLRDYATRDNVQVIANVEPQTIANAIAAAMDNRDGLRSRAEAAARMVDARYGEQAVRRVYREINDLLKWRVERDTVAQASHAR
jgi:glycosyltransferase involved in cell wall biosynthesis